MARVRTTFGEVEVGGKYFLESTSSVEYTKYGPWWGARSPHHPISPLGEKDEVKDQRIVAMDSTFVNYHYPTTRYKVIADDPRFDEVFTNYHEAMTWLNIVRLTMGCNAGIYKVEV